MARARNVAIGITRHHGAWAANAIVSGRELARTPCPGRVDRDTNVLFTGRGAGGSAGGMGCLPTLADSPAASIRTSPGPVALPWSTAAAGWGAVGSNRTLLHTPPGNPAGPLALVPATRRHRPPGAHETHRAAIRPGDPTSRMNHEERARLGGSARSPHERSGLGRLPPAERQAAARQRSTNSSAAMATQSRPSAFAL